MGESRKRKKRIIVFTLVFAMLWNLLPNNMLSGKLPTVHAASTNLVADGDFEGAAVGKIVNGFTKKGAYSLGDSSWNCCISNCSVTVSEESPASGKVEIVSVEGHDGNTTKAVKLEGECNYYMQLYQKLYDSSVSRLETGKKYVASMWIKAVGVASTTEGNVLTRLVCTANSVSSGSGKDARLSVKGDAAWTKVEVEFTTVEKSNPEVQIFVEKLKDGYILIDDVSITEVYSTIALDFAEMVIEEGSSQNLVATVTGEEPPANVVWTSSDENVAVVAVDEEDNTKATVNAIGEGNAHITATLYPSGTTEYTEANVLSKASCTVTVGEKNYFINAGFEEYEVGTKIENHSTGTPYIGGDTSLGWRASIPTGKAPFNYEVVANGRTGKAMRLSKAESEITSTVAKLFQMVKPLTAGDKYKFSMWVKMVDQADENANTKVYVKDQLNSIYQYTDTIKNATDWQELTYEFVAGGDAEGNTRYTFEIEARDTSAGYFLFDDVSLVRLYTVPALAITVDSVEVESIELGEVGDESALVAALQDPDQILTQNPSIQWSSSDVEVATVDENGKVTAHSIGIATITASVDGGISDTCTIIVGGGVVRLTNITMVETTAQMSVGSKKLLSVAFTPEKATNKSISWSSSDETVAIVAENGEVTALEEGTAVITASYSGDAAQAEGTPTAACTITVHESTGITNYFFNGDFEYDTVAKRLAHTSATGTKYIGNSGWRGWVPTGSNVDFKVVKEGRNDSYAMQVFRNEANGAGGKVRASVLQTIEGLTIGDKYAFSLWVKMVNQTSSSAYTSVKVEDKLTNTTVTCGMITNVSDWKEITYEFTAIAEKYAFEIMSGDCVDGYFLIDDVSLVRLPTDPTLLVTLEKEKLEIEEEMTASAEVIDPDNVLNEEVSIQWNSDDTSVATVDQNGKVTAVGVGETYITAEVAGGDIGAAVIVKVVEKEVPVTGITMTVNTAEMSLGSQKVLNVTFTPENATNKLLIWSSSNETVATVDQNGRVTAWKVGETTITARVSEESEQGSLKAVCTITVKESNNLSTETAVFTTPYGTRLSGSLAAYVTNNTGSAASYQLLTVPVIGTLELAEDSSFIYIPKGYGDEEGSGHTDSFTVGVTVGEESAILEGQITMKPLSDSIAEKLQSNTTLMITRDKLAEIREDLATDDDTVRDKIWKNYQTGLQSILGSTPPENTDPECAADCSNDSVYASLWQRTVGNKTAQLLWAYLFTGDEEYKEKCIEYTTASVNYKHWGSTSQYMEANLAAGHQASALGLVYNWMHEELKAENVGDTGETLEEQTARKLYYTCGRFYEVTEGKKQYMDNTLWVRISGLASASMSLYIHAEDVAAALADGTTAEAIRANCITWLERVYEVLGYSYQWAPKDGASQEGAGYYTYGVEYLLKSTLLLNANLGIDMLTENTWLKNNSEYFLNVMLPQNHISYSSNMIAYADGVSSSWYGPSHIFRTLAGLYGDETAQWIAEIYESTSANSTEYEYWLGLLFADDSVTPRLEENKATLYYADDLGMINARTNWSGNESFVFFRCGLPLGKTGFGLLNQGTSENHVDPDCNAVVLYSNGEYLLRTDGYADQKRTKNHSTLLVNGNGQIGGNESNSTLIGDLFQELGLEPEIKVTKEGEGYSYFVGDATEAYHPDLGLKKFERNVVLLEEENVLLVVDDIKTAQNKELELRWFPESKIVAEAYGTYIVTGANNTMKFFAFTDDATTEFKDADVYIGSGNDQKEKAFIQTYNGLAWQNAVAFSWSASDENQTHVRYIEGNANEHKFEVNGKVYSINVVNNTVSVQEGTLGLEPEEWESDSLLSNILLNGYELEGFDSNIGEYTVDRFWKTEQLIIRALPNSPTATVELIWDGTCPGTATIVCTSGDKSSTSTYKLNMTNDNNLLSIKSATAVPNTSDISTEFTYDSYIQQTGSGKNWASKNLPVLTYDMGKLVDITKIDVAFNYSRDRETYYDLLISEDGSIWTTIDERNPETGGSAITTTGNMSDFVTIYEGTVRARYVQFKLRSHTESGYDNASAFNSIQEISFYGVEVEPSDLSEPSVSDELSEIN